MYCKNLRCIYNQDSACKADAIHLDQYGKCADCVYPDQNQQGLQNPVKNTVFLTCFPKPRPVISNIPSNLSDKEDNPELKSSLKKHRKRKR